MSRLARFALVVAGLLVAVLVAIQLFVPGQAASDVESRLTEGGGEADVEIEALPAVRLLWGDGDRIEVRGSDLVLDVENDTNVLDRLDGFDQVDVSLAGIEAGPFEVGSFELRRQGGGAYTLRSEATTSGTDLLDFGADNLGPIGGPIAGFLSDQAPEQASEEFDVQLDAQLESDDGQIRIVEGGGSVEGYEVGPLAEIITVAVVSRL